MTDPENTSQEDIQELLDQQSIKGLTYKISSDILRFHREIVDTFGELGEFSEAEIEEHRPFLTCKTSTRTSFHAKITDFHSGKKFCMDCCDMLKCKRCGILKPVVDGELMFCQSLKDDFFECYLCQGSTD